MTMLIRSMTILGLIGLTSACATGPAPRSGFLGDYSRMTPKDSSDSLIQQRPSPTFDVTRYRAVLIDPTDIRVERLDEDEKKQLADVFRAALIEELGGALPVVEKNGPGVLRVRTAIIEARKANVAINVISSLLITPVTRGGVAAEAEIVDGQTGERIAALSWSRRGAKIAEAGLPYTELGEARSGLRSFADRLAKLFLAETAPEAREATGSKR